MPFLMISEWPSLKTMTFCGRNLASPSANRFGMETNRHRMEANAQKDEAKIGFCMGGNMMELQTQFVKAGWSFGKDLVRSPSISSYPHAPW